MMTANDIYIAGSFTVDTLLAFHLTEKLNNHTRLRYRGIVEESRVDQMILTLKNKGNISIYLAGTLVFSGLPLETKLECINELYTLTVCCVSHSYLLDVEPRSASFQDTSFSHRNVLDKLYEDNKTGQIQFRRISDCKIGRPIIKYNETDWQFTLRMAARTNNVVYPHSASDFPAVYMGIKHTNLQPGSYYDYREGYDTERYDQQQRQRVNVSLTEYFYIRLRSENHWNLGETLSVKGAVVAVCEKVILLKENLVEIQYLLSGINPYIPKEKTNGRLAGLTLSGRVIDTRAEQIKLHLAIDPSQDKETAYWFDYKPITGNVFHSMPQHGTIAMLKMNRRADHSGLVTHVIHKNAATVEEMADYNKRYFTTEFRKRLAMIPMLLDFKSDDNFLELADASGITGTTTAHFRMIAERDITIHAKKKLRIATPEKVYITKVGTDGGIDMSGGDIHIKSLQSKLISRSRKTKRRKILYKKLPPIEMPGDLALKAGATIPVINDPGAIA